MTMLIRLILSLLLWLSTACARTDGPMTNKCSYAQNDANVVTQEQFRISPPSGASNARSAVWYNGNNKIIYLRIIKQNSIPLSVFTLRNLQRLKVDRTCFEPCDQHTIPSNIACLASSLTELRIKHTKITHLPWQIGSLTHLEVLELSHTGLRSLPASIGHLSSLNILDLSYNHLRNLPKEMQSLQSLKQFTVSYNHHLHSIQAINGLPALWTLDAKNCSIEHIPRRLPQLIFLYLSRNSLTDLTGIAELGQETESKKFFSFEHNRIKQLPSGLNRVVNLEQIKLDYNCLEDLSEELYKMPHLVKLSITFNRISKKDMDTYCSKLRDINPKLKIRYENQNNVNHCKN